LCARGIDQEDFDGLENGAGEKIGWVLPADVVSTRCLFAEPWVSINLDVAA
jgi:hypothetical protein